MAEYYGGGGGRKISDRDLAYWIITVILLVTPLWPIGLLLLIRKLTWAKRRPAGQSYDGARPGEAVPGTQGMAGAAPRRAPRPVDSGSGMGLTIVGIVLAVIFGLVLAAGTPFMVLSQGTLKGLALLSPVIGCFGAGLILIVAGSRRGKRARRFRRYLSLIGARESVSIVSLAQAMPVGVRRACGDLQQMLEEGYLPVGYLDMGSGRLVLSEEGLREEPEASAEAGEDAERVPDTEDAILEEIRGINRRISDPEMSRKIDRIGELTGKIFAYQRQNPGGERQIRTFLSYYLPTTLKILRAYAQMEAQGVDGENIRAAKARIEGMMDKVVEGFEKQLDRLFQNDAMDITADVEVLERMLQKDGLSGGDGLTLGG